MRISAAALAVAVAAAVVPSSQARAVAQKNWDPAQNAMLLADMAQNNPGDHTVGWQSTKFTDAWTLSGLNITTRVTTGELSPFLTINFDSIVPGGIWAAGSAEAEWAATMEAGVRRHAAEAHAAGVKFLPFVDMIVLPKALVSHFGKAIVGPDGKLAYNTAMETILSALLNETFAKFPDVDGILIRTGETYVYDTPYHIGNSPTDGVPSANQTATWVRWLTQLRQVVCVDHGKIMVQRAWDSFGGWTGDPAVYQAITDPVPPHELLYFSVKVSAGDFFRYMPWNGQLGVGKHAQLVEVEMQREYEGKLAHVNYIPPGYIYGFGDLPDGSDAKGIIDVLSLPQIRGLWTWSRGGGWWGPYIHQREEWVDAGMAVMACWWNANFAAAKAHGLAGRGGRFPEAKTEEECFAEFAKGSWGVDTASPAYTALRSVVVNSSDALIWSRYCPEGPDYSSCWIWTRDDRLGGLQGDLGKHFATMAKATDPDAAFNASLAWKARGVALWQAMLAGSEPLDVALRSGRRVQLANYVQISIEYGLRLYSIVSDAWEVFAWGVRHDHGLPIDKAALAAAIQRYDVGWAGFQSFGLAYEESPSLYYPYYWNPPGGAPSPGMNASVNTYRPLAQ